MFLALTLRDRKLNRNQLKFSNWYGRPNPEGRIIRKLEGRIINEMAEQLEKWKAEFDH